MDTIKVQAVMMDSGVGQHHGGEQRYEFEAPADLFDKSPIKVIKAFMEHVDHIELPAEHLGYELYSALKHPSNKVVTGLGCLLLRGNEYPFMVMISPVRA